MIPVFEMDEQAMDEQASESIPISVSGGKI
jgi:hypothetical protein